MQDFNGAHDVVEAQSAFGEIPCLPELPSIQLHRLAISAILDTELQPMPLAANMIGKHDPGLATYRARNVRDAIAILQEIVIH